MGDYIERPRNNTNQFGDLVCNGEDICPDDTNEFTGRWSYLNNWDKWEDVYKASIFTKMVVFVRDPDLTKSDMDEKVSVSIAETSLNTGRKFLEIKFDLTSNSAIIAMLIFSDAYSYIPECVAKEKIREWGIRNSMLYIQ